MDQEELRTLRLLEAIEAQGATSQRELARHLNVSLGLANAFVKRSAKKGYFTTSTTLGKRVNYHLTPKGLQEKTRLAYKYIDYLIGFYRDMKSALQNLFSRLAGEGVERLALYGCGEVAELAYLLLHDSTIALAGVFDDGGDGREFFGHPVRGWEAIPTATFDCVFLTQTENLKEHHERLVQAGVDPSRILDLNDHVK
jgi:DNA-binding MarR family transcriptional regulator